MCWKWFLAIGLPAPSFFRWHSFSRRGPPRRCLHDAHGYSLYAGSQGHASSLRHGTHHSHVALGPGPQGRSSLFNGTHRFTLPLLFSQTSKSPPPAFPFRAFGLIRSRSSAGGRKISSSSAVTIMVVLIPGDRFLMTVARGRQRYAPYRVKLICPKG